jgi:3-dehydroquinate dehydratase-1
MRLLSETRVQVRGKVFGGANPLICLPLVAKKKLELLQQAGELKQLTPDLLEWRIDSYENVEEVDDCLAVLALLRQEIGNIPIIFTCRIDAEGGFKSIGAGTRLKLIQAAIGTGHLDLVDAELSNETAFLEKVKEAAVRQGTKVIFSYHNFDLTPDEAFIVDKLVQAQEMGADIAKVAVMPKNYKDVLVLLNATLKARTERLKIPLITMSMGPEGGVTRLAGGLFGSDLTFAVGKELSAPGQIPIGDLRKAMAVIYDLDAI